MKFNISNNRINELQENWNNENANTDTQEWRDGLTEEEQRMVAVWDTQYDNGILKIAKDILHGGKKK